MEICDDIGITDAIHDMEEEEGKDYLLEQLHSAIGVSEFVKKICYELHEKGDVLILVMYPGIFDGHHLKLFDKLQPNDYYRAFNVI